jgi:hypothetical protein
MRTEIFLSRGETVTSFEVPEAAQVKIDWPERKKIKITVPLGQTVDLLKENFGDILHPELLDHLVRSWPKPEELKIDSKSAEISSWNDVQIEVLPKKPPKNQSQIDLDRPRITIQMGLIVDKFKENCEDQLKPEFVEQVIRLWSDPDYPREVIPKGRNILIRDSF